MSKVLALGRKEVEKPDPTDLSLLGPLKDTKWPRLTKFFIFLGLPVKIQGATFHQRRKFWLVVAFYVFLAHIPNVIGGACALTYFDYNLGEFLEAVLREAGFTRWDKNSMGIILLPMFTMPVVLVWATRGVFASRLTDFQVEFSDRMSGLVTEGMSKAILKKN